MGAMIKEIIIYLLFGARNLPAAFAVGRVVIILRACTSRMRREQSMLNYLQAQMNPEAQQMNNEQVIFRLKK